MSNTIDERVVEMRFDNKHFESNVATSMSTLEKLKRSLKLDGATKGLENLSSAAKNNNISELGNAAHTVGLRFDAMYTMADQALRNITTRVQQTAESMVKAFTIDPIKSGFSEYETKMGSIQTILANTEHQGTTLDQVTAALDELNLYADKTIYNFQEMTRNIGTFTAAGVDLNTSVSAIQGIANLAAVSGSTSQQASTAMYQLSQALATGTVKLMDWNSVVNAGMGGKVFQNALIQTAAMLDGAADDVEAWQKKNIDSYGSFRDSLSQGAWLTSEVLTQTLKQFTMAAEEGSEEWEAFKKSLMETGYTETQAEEILKMANTATDAATKVKTFTQLMDTLKESAQSGWAQTWETIIGDFEEAKEFFTTLSDLFGGIIGDSAERRNNLFSGALSSNWDKLIGKINEAGIETSEFEESIRKVVGDDKLDSLIEDFGSLEKAVREGGISSDILKKALESIGGTTAATKIEAFVAGLEKIERKLGWGSVGDDVKSLQTALEALGHSVGECGIDGIIGPDTTAAIKEFQKEVGLAVDGVAGPETIAALKKAGTRIDETKREVNDLSGSCEDLIDVITKKSGRELLLESLMNVIHAIHRPLAAVGEALRNTFSVSPDQLYNALEALNKFTSKFVMKGVLDATTWDELISKINKLGIETKDFSKKLSEVLEENGVDVDKLKEKYGSFANAFNKGAISIDVIKETLLSFDGITESMLLGGETADKVRRAFEGLFAILEIIGTIAGGGIKVAFKVLTAIFDKFGMSALDVAASVGDALVAFRDWLFEGNLIAKSFDWLISKIPVAIDKFKAWFAVFKETPAVQKLIDAIKAVQEAFDKLLSGEIDISEFARSLGENLAKALKSLPGIAMQIASDFIAGFQNGISDSVGGIINTVVSFCLEFVAAFAEALGVQSPSWKAYETATDFFQGFINGASDMIGSVLSVLDKIGEQIVKVFKSFWDFITDESGNIEWGKLFAGGSVVATIWVLKQLATAFSGIANAFDGIGDLLENAGKVMKSFSKVLNGIAWDLKAQALQKMAIAIGILVASIWVLTTIDDPGKLRQAVIVIGILAGILIGLSVAMEKLGSASVDLDAESKKLNIKGIQNSIIQIGIALLLIAAAVKLIGDMKPEEAKQGFIGLAGIAVGMVVFLKAMSKMTGFGKDVSSVGTMMKKLAVAMILMVVACKLVGMLSAEDMLQGAAFAAGFAIFVIAITKVAKSSGNNVSKVGGMVLKLTIAMALMVGLCKLIDTLSAEEMLKGAAFAAGFVLFVAALVKVTKIGKKQQIAKLGGLVLSVSTSLLLMVGVCKLVGKLSVEEILKGAAFVAGFVVLLKVLVSILKIGNEQQMAKVAGTILAMSAAIAILAGVAVLLSFMDLGGLAKGIIAVGLLSAMMTVMIKALKGAQNAKGAIMMMAITIAVMAASIAALSFIDTQSLISAAGAMTIVMSAFALMIKSMKGIKDVKVGPLIALTGVVLILAGIIYILQDIDPLSAISSAGSLSVLMLAMSAVLMIISKISVNVANSLKGMLALTLMAVPLLALVVVLALMSGVENATANTKSLIALATTLTLLLIPLTIIGAIATTGVGAAAVGLGIAALLLMAVPLLALVVVLALMSGVENATANSELLIDFMTTMTDLLLKVSLVAPLAVMGVAAMTGLTLLMGAIGVMAVAIGALMEKFPSIQKFLDTGLPVLEQLAGSIGTMIGNFIGGIGEGLSDSLVKMGEDIADFMDQLATASDNASGIKGESFDGVKQLMDVMGDIALTTVGTSIGDIFTLGGTSMEKFQTDGVAFFDAMKAIGEASSGVTINEEAMNSVIGVAQSLADLRSSLEPIGGVMDWFTGRDDLATFGTNAGQFVSSMVSAFGSLDSATLNTEMMNSVIGAATSLADLQSKLEPIGGVITWFAGRDDLATFGLNIGVFIESMKIALSNLDGAEFNTEALNSIISAATDLATLQSSLEPIGGVITWFTGRDDLGTFGINVDTFIHSMKTAFSSLDGVELNTEAMGSIIDAATDLATLQSSLEPIGGVISWFAGRDDLGRFGINVAAFIYSMKTALATLDGATLNEEALTSVITAAERLSDLQSKLEPMGGVVSWFSGRDDLGTFGTNIGLFADAMGKLKTGMGEDGISEAVVASVTNAGTAIIELQKALPEEGWFDSKMNLSEFSDYVTDFATAMSTFSAKAAEIESGAVDTCISTAYRIKSLITSLVDLDTSGVKAFTGVGTGGAGADGPAYDIAQAIAEFSDKVADIDTEAVTVAVIAANKLKSLIANLVGLDTSGIENFKVGSIGDQMKDYADKVADIDTGTVSSSISAANRLKNLITSLVGLDTSGISNFKVGSIGSALKTYGSSVSGVNMGAISSSIGAANRLRNFISSLAGLNTSGVGSFKTAINQLSTVNIDGVVKAFSGASAKLSSAGADMIKGLIEGMQSKLPTIATVSSEMAVSAHKAVTSKASAFATAGGNLATKLATGISSKKGVVNSAVSSCLSSAASKIRDKYSSFYSAGSYLVTGFADGISANSYKAAAKAKAMAEAAAEAAREALDINSPSKVFKEIGSGVPEGFAMGIGMLGGEVKRSVGNMASTAIKSTRNAMTTVLDALNTDMDTQPTIRPVVDLSDVQTGAAAVHGMFNGIQTVGVQSNLNAINVAMNRKLQNGTNDDIISAINKLNNGLEGNRGDTYNFAGITYDNGDEISDAVQTLVRAARMGRRV